MKINNSNCFVSENGLVFGIDGSPIMATTCNENGKDLVFFVNEEDGFDMFNANVLDLFEEFDSSTLMFSIGIFEPEVIDEATNIKLPLNSEKDFKGMSINDRLEIIDKVPHVNLWVNPGSYNIDRYSNCWIWVELPKELEGIKYVPIIVFTSGGVSVHPYYHKYFLRSFDKRTRHLILGFCYLHGPYIGRNANYAFEAGKDELSITATNETIKSALTYKDSDAPKRINMGAENKSTFFKPAYNDYIRWIDSLKN